MNNFGYGTTMENLSNGKDCLNWTSKPNYMYIKNYLTII